MTSTNIPQVILQHKRDRSLNRKHLWVFSGAIAKVSPKPQNGDLVQILNSDEQHKAWGFWQNSGSIRIRVLSFESEVPDQDFYYRRLKTALELRLQNNWVQGDQTNACRIFHGEGDGIPGLIADWYNGTLVMQSHTYGVFRIQKMLCDVFSQVFKDLDIPIQGIFAKNEDLVGMKSEKGAKNQFLWGNSEEVQISENGNLFRIPFQDGQKTGFFLDQRDNRELLGRYAKNRKVLNVCSYTGGFSIYALNAGAKHVTSVDLSQSAIDFSETNVTLNSIDPKRHRGVAIDAFDFFKNETIDQDLIILDPPAFAKQRSAKEAALKGYRRLNRTAMRAIPSGGIIFTFSCSQVISKEDFRTMVFSSAAESGRSIQILHQLSQGADHPINLFHPETEYLKGLVLRVI